MAATNIKQIALYVTPGQHKALKQLSAGTRVPMQVYLREAIDDLLTKYRDSVDALLPPVRTVRKRGRKS